MSDVPRPKILVLPPDPMYERTMSARAREVLEGLGTVERNLTGRNLSREEVAALLPGCQAVMTSYDPPRFDAGLLDAAPDLRIIGHTGGSIKQFISPVVFERGIVVAHAAMPIAQSVGEWALTVTLMALRGAHTVNGVMHAGGGWPIIGGTDLGHELYHKRVGIIGTSMTGKTFIRLLKPFDVEVWVYDPYLSDDEAAELGVRRVHSLEELMAACDIVSNHAPTTEETNGMIGARQLGLVQDGALFVNTARAAAVDYDALLKELQTGRFAAALDVFVQEPLVADSPFRTLPNVILSPHVAGNTVESRKRRGETIAEEFARFFGGQPLRYQVTIDMLPIMA